MGYLPSGREGEKGKERKKKGVSLDFFLGCGSVNYQVQMSVFLLLLLLLGVEKLMFYSKLTLCLCLASVRLVLFCFVLARPALPIYPTYLLPLAIFSAICVLTSNMRHPKDVRQVLCIR